MESEVSSLCQLSDPVFQSLCIETRTINQRVVSTRNCTPSSLNTCVLHESLISRCIQLPSRTLSDGWKSHLSNSNCTNLIITISARKFRVSIRDLTRQEWDRQRSAINLEEAAHTVFRVNVAFTKRVTTKLKTYTINNPLCYLWLILILQKSLKDTPKPSWTANRHIETQNTIYAFHRRQATTTTTPSLPEINNALWIQLRMCLCVAKTLFFIYH